METKIIPVGIFIEERYKVRIRYAPTPRDTTPQTENSEQRSSPVQLYRILTQEQEAAKNGTR